MWANYRVAFVYYTRHISNPVISAFGGKVVNTSNASENIKHARQSYAVTPHLIFGGIGVRIGQPLADLLFGLGFGAATHNPSMGFKYLTPKMHILFRGVFRSKA